MAAPASNNQPGAVDNEDVQFWTNKVNDVLSRPGEVLQSKSSAEASTWHNAFFSCFEPIDLCLITWCLPCITFGKTHHLLHKDGNLAGYQPINTSCLLYCGSSCFGLHWVATALQRHDIREKHNLEGSCLMDLAAACCCSCCTLVQMEKEAQHRVTQPIDTGYTNQADMTFPNTDTPETKEVLPAA